jgi:hypothetical protein
LQIISNPFEINTCGNVFAQNIPHHEIWPLKITGKSRFLPGGPLFESPPRVECQRITAAV